MVHGAGDIHTIIQKGDKFKLTNDHINWYFTKLERKDNFSEAKITNL